MQPAAADGRSSTKIVLPENENPAARDGCCSTKAVLCHVTMILEGFLRKPVKPYKNLKKNDNEIRVKHED